MKYKVGDKVRVRKDLVVNNEYGGILYILDMDELRNKEDVIIKVGSTAYRISNSNHWWSEEMLELVDEGALLEYALEKLEMTKEELEDEMRIDKEDMAKAIEMVRLNNEVETYCNLFNASCEGCKVREFMNKYSKVGKMECNDVHKYLKEKGEI